MIKKISIITISFFLILSLSSIALGADGEDSFNNINDLRPIIENVFNIAVLSAGVVLVGAIAFGIWKSSLAGGDPRGLEGAKQTWSYALYGFMVIVLFFAIFSIAQSLLGIPVLKPSDLLDGLFEALNALVNEKFTD